jgi:mannose-6-phosphate isomerase-like protein (cupin superfamily)/quinol monooxygenase YgiN
MVAREGKVAEAAALLLAAADDLRADPGCELYLINRQADRPDTIWVTELWRSREDLDATVEKIRGSDRVAQVMALVQEFEMVELEELGGKGPTPVAADSPPYTRFNLANAEDQAAKHGFGHVQEARFPHGDLDARQTGLAHLRIKPNMRQPFAHRHRRAEEVYLVLSGSGRAKLDDEVLEVGRLDAIRIAPTVERAFEAGPEGLELLAFSARHPGDAEMVTDPGWWD